jgi:hypothetical protein
VYYLLLLSAEHVSQRLGMIPGVHRDVGQRVQDQVQPGQGMVLDCRVLLNRVISDGLEEIHGVTQCARELN